MTTCRSRISRCPGGTSEHRVAHQVKFESCDTGFDPRYVSDKPQTKKLPASREAPAPFAGCSATRFAPSILQLLFRTLCLTGGRVAAS